MQKMPQSSFLLLCIFICGLMLHQQVLHPTDLDFWKASSFTLLPHLNRKYIAVRKWDVLRIHFHCDFKMWAWFPAVASQTNRKSWASISGEAHVLPRATRPSSATVSFYWYWSVSCGVTLNTDWESTGWSAAHEDISMTVHRSKEWYKKCYSENN